MRAGQLDESVAKGLDFVFAEASKHGIMLTPVRAPCSARAFLPAWQQMCLASRLAVPRQLSPPLLPSLASLASCCTIQVLLNLWKESGVPLFEGFCGTAGKSSQPRPDLEKRPLGGLNATERLQTPYEWLMSPVCKEQVRMCTCARS